MPNKYLRFGIAAIFLLGLIAVRMYESKLFYDPILAYFRTANPMDFPKIDETKLYIHILFRYMINLLLKVLIVKMVFWNKSYVKFTILVGIVFFILLLPLYVYQLKNNFVWEKTIFFYTRRFLIQPMLLLILIPCFYYQEIKNKKAIN